MSAQSSLRVRPLSFALALCVPLLGGCAEERAPINRVQPNALAKSFFVGALADASDDADFYYQASVVDVDYGSGQSGVFTASYAQKLSIIHWEISEDILLGRLAYDRIDGTTGEIDEGSQGQIVAAFAIQSHFDIKRGYNPQTGEELNVVEENTSDRPWYEREFMRVDWSQNLITTAYELDTLAALRMYADPLTYEPVAYFVEEPSSPDRPFFSPDEGYFDVTNKVWATPQMIDTPFGSFSACLFTPDIFGGSFPDGNCNPTEVKLRLSFKRVEDTDYEPVHWDGTRMDMFGMFTFSTRLGYDRNYGVVDDQWYRFASRHNIWAWSHARDAAGELIRCNTPETTYGTNDPTADVNPFDGTHDECASAGVGSRCDRFKQACTEPYRTRETKTIAIHYGPDSDPELWETARDVTAEWDGALRHAVQTARYTECVRTGGDLSDDLIASCKSQYPIGLSDALAAVPEILVFCHNPVTSEDHPACGTPGDVARVGDLRHHMVNLIEEPQIPSPWGIMSDAVDPLTGEVVSASINVWNAVTDLQSQAMVDMMRWYNGELSNEDVISGSYVSLHSTIGDRRSPGWASPPVLSGPEAEDRLLSLDRSLVPEQPVTLPDLDQRSLVRWAISQTTQRYGDQALGYGDAPLAQRFTLARGGGIENALVTEPYAELAGAPPGSTAFDTAALDRVSPLRGNFFSFRSELDRQRHTELAKLGRCMLEAPEPSSVVDLGRLLDQKFPLDTDPETPGIQADEQQLYERNEKWRNYVKRRLTHGVLSHEMGHSMGLRHVFTSSFDALNYRPQYWQLRTRDGEETRYCTEPTSDGTRCIGPRWRDPVTETERNGLIYTWQQTSVMEYPGDLTQDMLDIGAYDRAAIRFGYADVTDVWDDRGALCPANGGGRSCTRAGEILQDRLDNFGGIGGPWWGASEIIHYTRLHQELGLIRNCAPADLSPPADWDAERDGAWIPELDGKIVNGTVCETPPVDHVSYSDLELAAPGFVQVDAFAGQPRKFDALGRVRRPYMFGSDEYADTGNTAVLRSDNGADAYEQTQFLLSEYEDRHLWDNYRRNRTSFSLTRALNRSYGRYLDKIKRLAKGYAFLHEIYAGAGALDTLLYGEEGDGALRASALATSLAFDHFARVLTRPSKGDHARAADAALGTDVLISLDRILSGGTSPSLVVPDGSIGAGNAVWLGGRPLYNGLDGTKGYWSTDYQLFAGSYYDKTQVAELLTDPSSNFIEQNREDYSDARYRNVSFATLYPDGVRRLLATALTQDADLLGWRAAGRNDSSGGVSVLRDDNDGPSRPLGYRVWWPAEGVRECWPGDGAVSCTGYDDASLELGSPPEASIALDPEVGWEVQKFVIFWSLAYLPDNWKFDWVDMMRIWVVGSDNDPGFPEEERIAWRDPLSGQLYVAHRYGTEEIMGKTVQRGLAARTLEWMNRLTREAYEITSENPLTGELTVARHADDTSCPAGQTSCVGQPVETSREYSLRATNYKSVLDFMRQVTATFGFYDPAWRGLYQ